MVAVGLQALDDAAPARAVGPCAMDENDIRPGIHLGIPSRSFPDDQADPTMPSSPVGRYPQHYCTSDRPTTSKATSSAACLLAGRRTTGRSGIKFFYPNGQWWHSPKKSPLASAM